MNATRGRTWAWAAAALAACAGMAAAFSPPDDGHAPAAAPPAHESPAHAEPGHADPAPAAKPEPAHAEPAKPARARGEAPTRPSRRPAATPSVSAGAEGSVGADEALRMLREGNTRWTEEKPEAPSTDAARRKRVATDGQKPFAAILTCADSRLPVERVFDRGVGELFVVRVAGNVAGDSEIGTIEYGVEHLNTPVLVVMGHVGCGAVQAAMGKGTPEGKIGGLVEHIRPAVERARNANAGADAPALQAAAIRENVWQSVFDVLRESAIVRGHVRDGKLKIVGAVCDIQTGRVDWMGEHPWQSEILASLTAGETKSARATDDSHE